LSVHRLRVDAGRQQWEVGVSGELVLVTGGSGFIGTRCILTLLDAGYRVRTTVRSLAREAAVRTTLASAGAQPGYALTFVEADLMSDVGWTEAVAGCDFVLHVASPFPLGIPKDENELIAPAREGALRVLRAARDAGVKRVVLTSSFAAVGYGTVSAGATFTEQDWTDPDGEGVSAYVKSKTLAERAAWDFIDAEGGALELAVVNPVGVFGPVLGSDYSTSIEIVVRLMDGSVPGIPHMSFSAVDVRDVADLHLRAMTDPAAKGERFLAVAGPSLTMKQIADVLRSRMGQDGRRVPTRVLPNWMVRLAAMFDSSLKQVVPELDTMKNASNEKARRVLGWEPRSNDDAIVATAQSLVQLGLLKEAR
jgi:nucleoside-diphosphate-sugar epimerase